MGDLRRDFVAFGPMQAYGGQINFSAIGNGYGVGFNRAFGKLQ